MIRVRLIRVLDPAAVITRVAHAVQVGVELVGVGDERAVVRRVRHAVAVRIGRCWGVGRANVIHTRLVGRAPGRIDTAAT